MKSRLFCFDSYFLSEGAKYFVVHRLRKEKILRTGAGGSLTQFGAWTYVHIIGINMTED